VIRSCVNHEFIALLDADDGLAPRVRNCSLRGVASALHCCGAAGRYGGLIMRSKLVGLLLGCGLLAATMAPSLACSYNTQASSEAQPPQQTAQAQLPPTNAQQPPADMKE
jgi:hypothetical protein